MLNILQPLNFVLFTHAFVASSFSVIDFFLAFKKSIYTKYHCLLSQNKNSSEAYPICAPKLGVPKFSIAVQTDLKYPLRYHYHYFMLLGTCLKVFSPVYYTHFISESLPVLLHPQCNKRNKSKTMKHFLFLPEKRI